VSGLGAPIHALLIEDNPGDARLIREMLRDAGVGHAAVELAHADRLALGLEQFSSQATDVVLLDLTLPDSQGFDTFTTVHAHAPDVAIVVLSGLDDEGLAVRAVQEGAQDYLVKGQSDSATSFSRACRTTCARRWQPSKPQLAWCWRTCRRRCQRLCNACWATWTWQPTS
jgi:DNA-binding NarL/FixJ family response regulator